LVLSFSLSASWGDLKKGTMKEFKKDLVGRLELLLREAKSGEITSLACVYCTDKEVVEIVKIDNNASNHLEMLGSVELLKHSVIQDFKS